MICRIATQDDIPNACRLLNEIIEIGGTTAYEELLDESEFSSHFLTGNDCIYCCVCEHPTGTLVGFQALYRNMKLPPKWADIATFAQSSPKVAGVGTALFGTTLEFAQTSDISVINATIRADNSSGLAYYAKMGFVDYHIDKAVPLSDGTLIDRISRRYEV